MTGASSWAPWPRSRASSWARARWRGRGHGVLDDGRPAVARVVEIERPELGRVGRHCSPITAAVTPALLADDAAVELGAAVEIEAIARPELGAVLAIEWSRITAAVAGRSRAARSPIAAAVVARGSKMPPAGGSQLF
jgi:hypothetical protein